RNARPSQRGGPAVGRHRPRQRGIVGQLPPDLFAGRPDQLRRPAEQAVERNPMSRLIVISNRVSAVTEGEPGAQGGLSVALTAALREMGGIWFGWSGEVTDEFTGQITFARTDGVTTATVDLEEQDVEEYYNGYANRTLWPLFHYRIDFAEFERDFAVGYRRANERFADTVQPLIEPDDAVLVQDYHVIPLAALLRSRGFDHRNGFLLPTPRSPRRLLSTLPEAKELVGAMAAYDVVGFHTDEWLQSFRDFAVFEMNARIEGDTLHIGRRSVRMIVCPIGIDASEFRTLSQSDT